jgi:dihydropteroate synthase
VLELDGDAPLIMGIVNIGDDSVAERVHLRTLDEQLFYAQRQLADGAQIIDIGVQSGRTDTGTISEAQELERLLPLVGELAAAGVLVSVDTWRPGVARGAIDAGAALINDMSGLADMRLADAAARSGAALVVMHTRARPKQASLPNYRDPLADVLRFHRSRIEAAIARGVHREQLLLDPGLDFAKTPKQSIEILRRLRELHVFERPVLLAVSRKYFIGMLTGKEPEDRLAGTLAAVNYGLGCGVHMLRVHDVGAVAEFLHVRSALLGQGEPELRGSPRAPELKWLEPKLAPAETGPNGSARAASGPASDVPSVPPASVQAAMCMRRRSRS